MVEWRQGRAGRLCLRVPAPDGTRDRRALCQYPLYVEERGTDQQGDTAGRGPGRPPLGRNDARNRARAAPPLFYLSARPHDRQAAPPEIHRGLWIGFRAARPYGDERPVHAEGIHPERSPRSGQEPLLLRCGACRARRGNLLFAGGSLGRAAPFHGRRNSILRRRSGGTNCLRAHSFGRRIQSNAERIWAGTMDPGYSFVPPGIQSYGVPATVAWKDVDPFEREDEAKRLLAEAGFGPGGEKLAVEMRFNNSDNHRATAVAVA